jgi:hypothetical protein
MILDVSPGSMSDVHHNQKMELDTIFIFCFSPFVNVIKTINTGCAGIKEQFFIWAVSTCRAWYGQKTIHAHVIWVRMILVFNMH